MPSTTRLWACDRLPTDPKPMDPLSMRLLLVEDEPLLRSSLQADLKRAERLMRRVEAR